MNRLRPMLAALLIACAADAGAQAVYRWIDANGRVQYTSEKPPGVPSSVVQPRINSYGGTPAAGVER